METTIANTKQQTTSIKATRSNSDWSRKLSLFTLIAALVVLAVSTEMQIPSALLAFYEEMQQQLNLLEKLIENPSVLIGNK